MFRAILCVYQKALLDPAQKLLSVITCRTNALVPVVPRSLLWQRHMFWRMVGIARLPVCTTTTSLTMKRILLRAYAPNPYTENIGSNWMDGLIVVLIAGDGNARKRKPMRCANVIVLDATIGSRKVTSRGELVKVLLFFAMLEWSLQSFVGPLWCLRKPGTFKWSTY